MAKNACADVPSRRATHDAGGAVSGVAKVMTVAYASREAITRIRRECYLLGARYKPRATCGFERRSGKPMGLSSVTLSSSALRAFGAVTLNVADNSRSSVK